jgi:toxin ParE1/3/4
MTGRINYTPEAQQQLNALDDWITEKASREVAQRSACPVVVAGHEGAIGFEHGDRVRVALDGRPARQPTRRLK